MRILQLAGCLVTLAVLLAGCGSAAKLIPGNSRASEVATIRPTATSTAKAGPILVAPTLELGGSVVAPSGDAIPDRELARSVVQLSLLDGTNAVRTGTGVVIDLGQRLILTSFPLVDPVRSDGSRAYSTITVGTNRTAGADPKPEFEAEVVAADQTADLAVLRVVRKAGGQPLNGNEFDLPAVRIDQSSDAGPATRCASSGTRDQRPRAQPGRRP